MSGVFDHPWLSGLFGDAEMAAIWSAKADLARMIAFEAAYSRALGAAGLADAAMAERAARAIEAARIDMDAMRDGTARDGLPVPALVAQLKRAAGEDAGAVHRGATSQDVIDSALACALRDTGELLRDRIGILRTALEALRVRFGDRALMGRTRMQAALPISVADRIETWARPLDDHLDRLERIMPQVTRLQLGGPVGTRADLSGQGAAVAERVAAALGLAPAPQWHARRDGVAEFAGLMSLISGGLGKMGQDLCLMAQQTPREVTLSGAGGSSAMAHKQNPVAAELLVTLARYNATQLSAMHQALVHEQERSGAAWQLEWMVLPQMAQATGRALAAAAALCDAVEQIGPSSENAL
ncbi:3-carboxy-cis,cis-muconate cycloisomerase [Limimaricola soesokkakensis]|uniref:3-carboxy-cis,cis-muconate cycloisomerase n=1 Tax=Limimaricola soesokkakensis TaxID=1343159 RepID=A0A1X7A5P4_9RHOB|nr:3-carboxy-cis,cis-muconate cycloisomerase [Limimaricola soesokkakensis]PSK80544.1 3-carboxy-cis,cis-muconate cycloisomerase [Limimaricola soesokkakensis]SLN71193.1 3-carboxy-cis,cis-muconate cycloisomerase [Limimaricola soesokkakensis]